MMAETCIDNRWLQAKNAKRGYAYLVAQQAGGTSNHETDLSVPARDPSRKRSPTALSTSFHSLNQMGARRSDSSPHFCR